MRMSSNKAEKPDWISNLLSDIANQNKGFSDFFETTGPSIKDKSQDKRDFVSPIQGLLLPDSPEYQRYLEEFSIRMTEEDDIYVFKYRVGELFSGNRAVTYETKENDAGIFINEVGTSLEDWGGGLRRQEHFVRQTTVKRGKTAGLTDVVKLAAFNFSNHRGLELQIGKLGYPHLANIYYLNSNLLQGAGMTNEDLTDFSHGVSNNRQVAYPLLINDLVWSKKRLLDPQNDQQGFVSLVFNPDFFSYTKTNIPISAGLFTLEALSSKYDNEMSLPGSDRFLRVDADFSSIFRRDIDVRLVSSNRGITDPHIRITAGREANVAPVMHQLMGNHASFDRIFESLPIQTIIKLSDPKVDFSLNT